MLLGKGYEDKYIHRFSFNNICLQAKEKGANKGLSGGYLEDGEDSGDENSYSIAAIKAKFKSGARDKKKPIYSSDEDDSDVEERKGKRLQKAKGVDSDSDSNR